MRANKTKKEIVVGLYRRLLHHFAKHVFPSKLRIFFHRLRGVNIGKRVLIGIDVHIDDYAPQYITIEDDVAITTGCMIVAHQINLNGYKQGDSLSNYPLKIKPITIKKGARIGVRSVIMPGITIGDGAVIGACSLVNKDIPAYSLAFGVPIKIISKFPNK